MRFGAGIVARLSSFWVLFSSVSGLISWSSQCATQITSAFSRAAAAAWQKTWLFLEEEQEREKGNTYLYTSFFPPLSQLPESLCSLSLSPCHFCVALSLFLAGSWQLENCKTICKANVFHIFLTTAKCIFTCPKNESRSICLRLLWFGIVVFVVSCRFILLFIYFSQLGLINVCFRPSASRRPWPDPKPDQ